MSLNYFSFQYWQLNGSLQIVHQLLGCNSRKLSREKKTWLLRNRIFCTVLLFFCLRFWVAGASSLEPKCEKCNIRRFSFFSDVRLVTTSRWIYVLHLDVSLFLVNFKVFVQCSFQLDRELHWAWLELVCCVFFSSARVALVINPLLNLVHPGSFILHAVWDDRESQVHTYVVVRLWYVYRRRYSWTCYDCCSDCWHQLYRWV